MAKIVAIEGIDGSGKSVQVQLLKQRLEVLGVRVGTRDYPAYKSFFGREVGSLLSGENEINANILDGKSMALWFALDRWDDLKEYKFEDYDVVLMNRYVLSNQVYQSIREFPNGEDDLFDWIAELEFNKLGIPKYDINFVLDVEMKQAGDNVDKKGSREYVGGKRRDVYETSENIQADARMKYLEFANKYDNIILVPCMDGNKMKNMDDIVDTLVQELKNKKII